jgi:translation initiation factor IF-1
LSLKVQICLTTYSTDDQNLTSAVLDGSNILTIDIENGDSVTVDLSSLLDNTDNQNLTSATISGNILTIDIENGDSVTVDLSAYLDNTDEQNLTSATLLNNILTVDIENGDSVTVDLTNAGTDDQNLTSAVLDGSNILTIDIENGDSVTVDLSSLLDNTDNQNLTSATISGNILTIDIENGDSVTVDLSAYLDNTDEQNLTSATLLNNILTVDIENGDSVTVDLTLAGTDDQNLTLSNDTLYIEDGNYVVINHINELIDDDRDTKVQVEESPDEDIIRFDMEGVEYYVMDAGHLEVLNTGSSIFIGENAGAVDDFTDNKNIAIGDDALLINVTGKENIAIGDEALKSASAEDKNIGIGPKALSELYDGKENVAIGGHALHNLEEGERNIAIGHHSLHKTVTTKQSVGIGYHAGQNIDDDYNTAVGSEAYNTGSYSNSSAFGYATSISANNQIRLGNSSVSSIGGQVGWTTVSDGRFKTDVTENVSGLEFILKLRPVTYKLDIDAIAAFNEIPDSIRLTEFENLKAMEIQTGFIAQEVQEAAQLSNYVFSGIDLPKNNSDYYGLRYSQFVVPLVKATQEQQNQIDELKEENQILRDKDEMMMQMILDMQERLNALENNIGE